MGTKFDANDTNAMKQNGSSILSYTYHSRKAQCEEDDDVKQGPVKNKYLFFKDTISLLERKDKDSLMRSFNFDDGNDCTFKDQPSMSMPKSPSIDESKSFSKKLLI